MTVVEKRDQVVDVLGRRAARRNDSRFLRFRDLLDQNPVIAVRTGDLKDGDAKFAAEINGTLVERSCHRNTAGFADGLHQCGVILRLETRVESFPDVADIVTVAKVPVYEAVEIAQLQFDGGAHV